MKTTNPKHQTSNNKLQTTNIKPQIPNLNYPSEILILYYDSKRRIGRQTCQPGPAAI